MVSRKVFQEPVVGESKWERKVMFGKKKERRVSKGFIGGALPNEKYTDDDLIRIEVLMDGLLFTVIIFVYTEKQDFDTQALIENFKHGGFNDERVCRWCIMHGLKFKVITSFVRWTGWKILYYIRLRYIVTNLEWQCVNKA